MKPAPFLAYLAEPHAEKMAFFRAIATEVGAGKRLGTWAMRWRGYEQTQARAQACLAAVAQHGQPVMIGFNRRFDPNFGALKAAASIQIQIRTHCTMSFADFADRGFE